MKKVLCSNIECIYNKTMKVNNTPVLVCNIGKDIIINVDDDKCNKYKNVKKNVNTIK